MQRGGGRQKVPRETDGADGHPDRQWATDREGEIEEKGWQGKSGKQTRVGGTTSSKKKTQDSEGERAEGLGPARGKTP